MSAPPRAWSGCCEARSLCQPGPRPPAEGPGARGGFGSRISSGCPGYRRSEKRSGASWYSKKWRRLQRSTLVSWECRQKATRYSARRNAQKAHAKMPAMHGDNVTGSVW